MFDSFVGIVTDLRIAKICPGNNRIIQRGPIHQAEQEKANLTFRLNIG